MTWLKKHIPWWPQLLAIMVGVGGIEGMRSGFGMIGRAVDIERLPDVVQAVDAQSKSRDKIILAVVQTNNLQLAALGTNVETLKRDNVTIKARREKAIIFINSLTNHPPIEWPATFQSSTVATKYFPEPP